MIWSDIFLLLHIIVIKMVSDRLKDRLWPAQGWLLTSSEIVSDKLRRHLRRAQETSATTLQTISGRWSRSRKKFCKKKGATPHQNALKRPVYRPSRWWGVASSPHQRPHQRPHHSLLPMRCCDAKKRRLLHITYHSATIITHHPSPITQMVGCLVRCLVRCFANTSPSETRMNKGFSGILVRC